MKSRFFFLLSFFINLFARTIKTPDSYYPRFKRHNLKQVPYKVTKKKDGTVMNFFGEPHIVLGDKDQKEDSEAENSKFRVDGYEEFVDQLKFRIKTIEEKNEYLQKELVHKVTFYERDIATLKESASSLQKDKETLLKEVGTLHVHKDSYCGKEQATLISQIEEQSMFLNDNDSEIEQLKDEVKDLVDCATQREKDVEILKKETEKLEKGEDRKSIKLEKERTYLEKKLEKNETLLTVVQGRVQELQGEKKDLAVEVKERDQNLSALNKDKEKAERTCNDFEQKVHQYEASLSGSQKIIRELQDEKKSFALQLERNEQNISTLRKETEKLEKNENRINVRFEKDRTCLEKKLEKNETLLTAVQVRVQELQGEKKDLAAEVKERDQNLSALNKDKEKAERTCNDFEQKVHQYEASLSDVQKNNESKIRVYEKDVTVLKGNVDLLQKDKAGLLKDVAKIKEYENKKQERLTFQIEEQSICLEDTNSEITQLKHEIKALVAQIKQHEKEDYSLKHENKKIQRENKVVTKQCDDLKNLLSDDLKTCDKNYHELQERFTEVSTSLDRVTSERSDVERKLYEAQKRYESAAESFKREAAQFKGEKKSVHDKLTVCHQEGMQYAQEVEEFRRSLDKKDFEYSLLKESNKEFRQQNEDLKAKINVLKDALRI